ncbi:hypothetical protein BH24BAC1_BH24BAC1_26480 [soil metagenome]
MKKPTLFLALALYWCCIALPASAQSGLLPESQPLPPHPRILLLAGEEVPLKKNVATNPAWQKLHGAILAECNTLLEKAPVERIQVGRRLLAVSRECLRRVFYLSYAYRMTQDLKYLRRAEQELLAVSSFSDWNPSHFLDVAEMTMAVAIGYDWLYDGLSVPAKAVIKNAILKMGIEPSLNPKYNAWLTASHNWNQVCNAGMTYGALAIYEDQPELARQIMDRALSSIVLPMKDYAPDGAYPEGYMYWGYGTSFNVMFISALEKAFGQDFGLAAQPGFLRSASYLLHMNGPSGDSFNYSDARLHGDAKEKGELQPALFWFAHKAQDPSLLWFEKANLATVNPKTHLGNRLLPAALLWGKEVPLDQVQAPSERTWVGQGKNPVALLRTSWTDPGALFVGLKAGSPAVGHAHMDVGSFVMEAAGVRWAMDFGMQEYNSLESKGVQLWGREQDAQRWRVFRYNNFVHNTLTVNRELQNAKGFAAITSHGSRPNFLHATTDLSELYQGQLRKANRGIAIVDQQYVTVRDEVEAADQDALIRWTLLTSAEVNITGKNTVELTKDGKKLLLKVVSPKNVNLKTWSTDPPADYDAPNPGTIMTGFETTVRAGKNEVLEVQLLPEPDRVRGVKRGKALRMWGR